MMDLLGIFEKHPELITSEHFVGAVAKFFLFDDLARMEKESKREFTEAEVYLKASGLESILPFIKRIRDLHFIQIQTQQFNYRIDGREEDALYSTPVVFEEIKTIMYAATAQLAES